MQYGVKSHSRHWHDSACLEENFGEPIQSDVTVIKKLQAERGGLYVNIRVYMMSFRFTHCGTSNLSSLFYFANSNFIMPVNIIILSFPSMLWIAILFSCPKKVPLWDFIFSSFFFCNALLCFVLSSMFVICFTLVLKAQSLNFILNHSIY